MMTTLVFDSTTTTKTSTSTAYSSSSSASSSSTSFSSDNDRNNNNNNDGGGGDIFRQRSPSSITIISPHIRDNCVANNDNNEDNDWSQYNHRIYASYDDLRHWTDGHAVQPRSLSGRRRYLDLPAEHPAGDALRTAWRVHRQHLSRCGQRFAVDVAAGSADVHRRDDSGPDRFPHAPADLPADRRAGGRAFLAAGQAGYRVLLHQEHLQARSAVLQRLGTVPLSRRHSLARLDRGAAVRRAGGDLPHRHRSAGVLRRAAVSGALPGLRAAALGVAFRQVRRLLLRPVYLRLPVPAAHRLPVRPAGRRARPDADRLRADADPRRAVLAPDRSAGDEAQAPVCLATAAGAGDAECR